jgi:hypothetical protein
MQHCCLHWCAGEPGNATWQIKPGSKFSSEEIAFDARTFRQCWLQPAPAKDTFKSTRRVVIYRIWFGKNTTKCF